MRPIRAYVPLISLGLVALSPFPTPLGSGSQALARGLFVSPSGNNASSGAIGQPWKTFAYAIGRLAAGDTLYLRGGTYLERTTVSVSGTASAPIVIRSYPGETATLDSGVPEFRTPGNSDWEPVNEAIGEWRSTRSYSFNDPIYAYVAGIPGYQNGRVALIPYETAAPFRATSDVYVDGVTPFYAGPGTFFDLDGRVHIRLAKTTDLVATEARYGSVFASALPDPRQYSILLSEQYTTLTVSGSYLTFYELTVNQALNSVYLNASAHDLLFDRCTIWLGDSSIESRGAHHFKLTRCRIYGDAPYWVFWSDMKDAPAPANLSRATSIDLREGTHDVEVSYCHIRGSGQDLIGTATNETGLVFHHNRIENAGDDAFEIEGTIGVGAISIYENYILNCLTAVAPGQDTPTYLGPLLVYRNVIASLRNPPVNRKAGINTWNDGFRYGNEYMFKHGTSAEYTTRNAHYYHNTLILLNHGGKGINFIPKDPTDGRICNNIAIAVNGVVSRDYRAAPGEVVDGNLYWKVNGSDGEDLVADYTTVPAFRAATGWEAHGIGSTPRVGTDPMFSSLRLVVTGTVDSRQEIDAASEVPQVTDFLLRSGSPAIGAGIVIPAHPTIGILPDTRASRDIGALPFGTSAAQYQGFPFVPGGAIDIIAPARPTLRVRRRP